MKNMKKTQDEYWKDLQNTKGNCEMIWKILKKIVKWYGNYGRKISWIVKRFGKYGRKISWIVKRYEKYERNSSWIVKWYGK